MKLRFGFVAMSLLVEKASPSQTMTVTNFLKIPDREAVLSRITKLANSNLVNTLRILRHAYASGIFMYRFSSRLIPLFGHQLTAEWDFMSPLSKAFKEIGDFVLEKGMRVSFHPDHYTLLNSPDLEIVKRSIDDLHRHVMIYEAMGLNHKYKLVIHIGGGYKDKTTALNRFITNWSKLPEKVKQRLTLENDDKIFTAAETLSICQQLKVPMVLDIHHHRCNPGKEQLTDLFDPIFSTWKGTGLPPKIHLSSAKCETAVRHHADYINAVDILTFLNLIEGKVTDLDIMVEAKRKDEALLKLVQELAKLPGFKQVSGGVLDF